MKTIRVGTIQAPCPVWIQRKHVTGMTSGAVITYVHPHKLNLAVISTPLLFNRPEQLATMPPLADNNANGQHLYPVFAETKQPQSHVVMAPPHPVHPPAQHVVHVPQLPTHQCARHIIRQLWIVFCLAVHVVTKPVLI